MVKMPVHNYELEIIDDLHNLLEPQHTMKLSSIDLLTTIVVNSGYDSGLTKLVGKEHTTNDQ